jgi:hypothetical protein
MAQQTTEGGGMNTTFKVRFWEIADWTKSKDKKKKKGRPYGVRWVTEQKPHSEWYSTKALAHSRRVELMQAARDGEPFDIESGLPMAELKRWMRWRQPPPRSFATLAAGQRQPTFAGC